MINHARQDYLIASLPPTDKKAQNAAALLTYGLIYFGLKNGMIEAELSQGLSHDLKLRVKNIRQRVYSQRTK